MADIEIVCAFDVNAAKVGRDLSEAVFAAPNNTIRFAEPPRGRRRCCAARRSTGSASMSAATLRNPSEPPADVRRRCARAAPMSSFAICPSAPSARRASTPSRRWRRAAPSSTAFRCFSPPNPEWGERFKARGLPIVGDDIKSQVGATIVHRVLANLMRERGVRLDRTYQLNFGGNADFKNMLERERLESKKISKTQAVTSQLDVPLAPDNVHVGPERFRALARGSQMGAYPA